MSSYANQRARQTNPAAYMVLALTVGLIASPLPAAEGALQDDTVQLRSTSSSGLEAAFAKCGFVDPPIVLDGSTANESDMARLADAITSYMQSMQASLQCLDVTEQDLKDGLSESQRSTISTIYNNGIDQMDFVAKEYNKQLRFFRLSDRTYTPLDVPF